MDDQRQDPRPNSPEDVGFVRPATPQHEPKRCSSCQAPILWAQLIDEYGDRVVDDETGRPKSLPVDFEPAPKGNVRVFDRHGSVVARVLAGDELEQVRRQAEVLKVSPRLRLSHFVTCPNAARHRRSR